MISRLLSISSSDENSSPSLSTMIRDVIESVQDNIDNYIEAHSSCEISKDEVRHGLEQSLSKPINDIKVYNPSMNTNTLHDSVRPNISEIENKLEK